MVLWIEGDFNQGCASRILPSGEMRFGSVADIKSEGVLFSGERWHASEDWQGESRWVISAFTPRDVGSVTEPQWSLLGDLGFPVDEVRARLGSGVVSKTARRVAAEAGGSPS